MYFFFSHLFSVCKYLLHFKFSIFTSTLFKLRKIWNGLKKKAGFQLISTGKPKECVTLCLYFLNETCISALHLWRERSDNHPNVGTLHSILYSNFYIWRINFTKRKIRNRLESLQSEWKKKYKFTSLFSKDWTSFQTEKMPPKT